MNGVSVLRIGRETRPDQARAQPVRGVRVADMIGAVKIGERRLADAVIASRDGAFEVSRSGPS
jgi:hypothetical protein